MYKIVLYNKSKPDQYKQGWKTPSNLNLNKPKALVYKNQLTSTNTHYYQREQESAYPKEENQIDNQKLVKKPINPTVLTIELF